MQAVITPSNLSGNLKAPASKSAMQRACAAALIKQGKTTLFNPGISADDKAALNIIQQLGAQVKIFNDRVEIYSNGVHQTEDEINCGESGLSVRMFTSIAALSDKQIIITGTGSLMKRPMNFFDEVLPKLGVQCKSNNGFLPLSIKGPLQPKNVTIDGSLSSQYLTGLLFAYSAAGAKDVTIEVGNLNSRPYVGMTLKTLGGFDLNRPVVDNYKFFHYPGENNPSNFIDLEFVVEADWSNAAFHLVAGAIAGNISVTGLAMDSQQGDKAIIEVLQMAHAKISIEKNKIILTESDLKAFEFDATDCPDLFPPLVSLAAYCNGVSVIKGVRRLIHKESNRAFSLTKEFCKMNVPIVVEEDLMIITGGNKLIGTSVSSHNDHRIAMACAVAGLKASGITYIDKAEAVNKSYPVFWKDLQSLGVEVSLIDNKN